MQILAGKTIILGITGGIAAYKSAHLCRLLTAQNARVQVVMTPHATQFITPLTFEALTRQRVLSNTFEEALMHIDLARQADCIVIAPASANTLAHLAAGFAQNLLQTLVLARRSPLLLVPAMNTAMWNHPTTQRNLAILQQDGALILPPQEGILACGEEGIGKMAEPEEIIETLCFHLTPKILKGKRVLMTAGPTFEPIDSVRGLTNLSSGKMGYALAKAACNAGAHVTLISGKTALPLPLHTHNIGVQTALEMQKAVMEHVMQSDIFISVAAVADYRAKTIATEKLKKNKHKLTQIDLLENPDILAQVAALNPAPFCVGFAAESENIVENAREKRQRKGIPLIVANAIQEGFGGENNHIFLIDAHSQTEYSGTKDFLAQKIIEKIAQADSLKNPR